MVIPVNIMKDKSTVAPSQYPRSLSKARMRSSVKSETSFIPLLNKYQKHSLMLSLSLKCCLRVSKVGRSLIAVVCRKHLQKSVSIHWTSLKAKLVVMAATTGIAFARNPAIDREGGCANLAEEKAYKE